MFVGRYVEVPSELHEGLCVHYWAGIFVGLMRSGLNYAQMAELTRELRDLLEDDLDAKAFRRGISWCAAACGVAVNQPYRRSRKRG